MNWNYRVLDRNGELAIYEVFYDDDGAVIGHTEAPVFPHAECLQDLVDGVWSYSQALQKPVLPYDETYARSKTESKDPFL
jgi:hypothetical protein